MQECRQCKRTDVSFRVRKDSGKACTLCKDCELRRIHTWKQNNPDKAAKAARVYIKRYRANHPEYAERWYKYDHEVLFKTIPYRIAGAVRSRITSAIRRGFKSAKSEALLGCTWDQFLGYLEIQFQDGMSWDNYGEWHVDHRLPCASFDLTNSEQQKVCFHYKNLQPLWADENRRKGSKVLYSVISGSRD